MKGDAILATKNLSVAYNGRYALRDVNLKIPKRQITAIIGPSGCGKSSFLHCLNRMTDLIPGCAVRGQVLLGEQDIFASGVHVLEVRKRVGMIFQKPNPFPLSIHKNIQLPLKEHGVTRRDELEQATENVLQRVGLWDETRDRLNHSARELSGGQQQRLCIARALALNPEVMLLDEPCSALDPISSGVVEDLTSELKQTVTIVVVTHNLAQAKRLADRAAMFWMQNDAGAMIESGIASELFNNPSQQATKDYIQGARG